ncbi:MAG: PQQ-binding-like beta-propeller repeat protein, partial [Planctomycetota bacterium]
LIVSFLELNWGDGAKPPPKQTFYAFNKFDGTILWRSQPGGKALDTIYTNPAIGEIGGVRQLVSGNTDGGACGIDARTGEPLWTFRMSKRGLNSSPVIHGDHVIISHGEDNIDTVAKGLGRVQCIDATLRGDITETGSVWRIDGIKAGYTAATLVGDVVYIVSDIGGLHAIDANDGTELWKFQVGTVGKGSPVFADGKLYVPETNGRFWILEPTREGVEVLDQDELQGTTVPGTDEIYASPAVAYGHVYMVTRDRTLCLGSGDFVMPEKPDVAITVLPYNPTPATYDRVRPDNGPLPWSYDFDDLKGPVAVPPAWVNAFLKVKPTADVKGAEGLCMKSSPGPGKPSFDVFLGPSTMTDYVIEADVMVEGRRRLSTVGVTNQKYTLMLKANQAKLDIVTWQAHLRLGSSQRFRARAGKWYRMKLDVEIIEDDSDDGAAIVRGKVWPRDEDEPADWTIECTDPHPNPQGSPGLYTYRLADSYIDNVTVTAEAD